MRIEIACNNPDNGIFDGKVYAIQIGSAEFYCNVMDWGPRLTEGDGWIRIGGKKLKCSGSKYGVGNWCWNAYWCETADVEALLNWPKFRGWFNMDSGPEAAFNSWKSGKPLRFKKQPTAGGAR